MPYRIDIYIGSDNASKKIYDDYLNKVIRWANGNFPNGYTLIRGQGCYNGSSEDALMINVLSDKDLFLGDPVKALKRELGQEAILLTRTPIELELI